jgi:hypothetical protein
MTYTRLDFDASRVSDDIRRLNPGLFGKQEPKAAPPKAPRPPATVVSEGPVIPRLASLNRTERRFYDECLAALWADRTVIQPTRFFPLKGGGTYTPDFIVLRDDFVAVYEIKGGYRGPGAEQGHERYARAAAQWSSGMVRFSKCTWDRKRGTWREEKWR